ncbi:MAG: DEAD/DEAH box helicase [Rickettsiales bacterium]|nr:DEAD/DEAH box helicase [Rickettsiales bacterium]
MENILRENINIGNLVVHRDYGIGRFVGLETIENIDFLKILYGNTCHLYVAVENIELITRYGDFDENVILDRLDNSRWSIKRNKVRKKINEMANELIQIATKRQLSKAPILVPNEVEYKDFCNNFIHKETDDQLRVIKDIEEDLKKGIPSDRLVCGDVGFGKTEIAIRAAFIVASNKMQIAIICPTTLLCRQHFQTFTERFKDTNFKISSISRLTKNNEQTKRMVENGEIDIIIGTHALLSANFKNIGLLVVDEEQRFGVQQKEKLKQISFGIHLLTLSATPIPRTLQMAMTGIRDLSIIKTPPMERIAVDTKITKLNNKDFEGAVKNEIDRSGKVLIVVPRISDIEKMETMIRRIK